MKRFMVYLISITAIFLLGLAVYSLAYGREIITITEFEASPAQIFDAITDYENIGKWHPSCKRIEGEKQVGSQITLFGNGGAISELHAEIQEYKPYERFVYGGKSPFPTMTFKLEQDIKRLSNGKTQLTKTETLTGLLSPFVYPLVKIGLAGEYKQASIGLTNYLKNNKNEQ